MFDHNLTDQRVLDLVARLKLQERLFRASVEEEIIELFDFDADWLLDRETSVIGSLTKSEYLEARQWTDKDLYIELVKDEALQRYSSYLFGAGLEDYFLNSKELRDQVVYSLIRVRDSGLIREIWIRLEEGEMSFSEASSEFGEGTESRHNGLYGPIALGRLQPTELASIIRNLQPGKLMKPRQVGEWHLIIRLEKLFPARFDADMADSLLHEQMEQFLQNRVNRLLVGETLEPLSYQPD